MIRTQDSQHKTPNFRMPAEWEPHEATWISWPKNRGTFPEEIIEKVEETFVQMIGALCHGEKVNILVDDAALEKRAKSKLDAKNIRQENIVFKRLKSSDVWIRDYGPTFVKTPNDSVNAIKWTYNAYGDKYDDLKYDNQAGEDVVQDYGKEIIRPDIVLEGGSIEVNGKGTLITTEQCLLNQNRNSKLTKKEIESKLKMLLGVTNIIWLGQGVVGDDTDGHIDDIARFVGDKKVVCVVESDPTDENYVALKKDFETLQNARDQNGEKLEVIQLPMPGKHSNQFGRLPASYANFYIGNKVILLPVFGIDLVADQKAVTILQSCFPDRKVVPINCAYLVWGLGTIHCSTQQEPK